MISPNERFSDARAELIADVTQRTEREIHALLRAHLPRCTAVPNCKGVAIVAGSTSLDDSNGLTYGPMWAQACGHHRSQIQGAVELGHAKAWEALVLRLVGGPALPAVEERKPAKKTPRKVGRGR